MWKAMLDVARRAGLWTAMTDCGLWVGDFVPLAGPSLSLFFDMWVGEIGSGVPQFYSHPSQVELVRHVNQARLAALVLLRRPWK